MTTTSAALCSWDSAPHPSYNFWGTGNVSEVLPGVSRPLITDLIGGYMYVYARGILDSTGVRDLVTLAELPAANVFGFFGGRWAVNFAWLGVYVGSFQPEQQSQMLAQFIQGDEEQLKSGVADNVRRARRTRRRMELLWDRSPATARRQVAVASNARRRALRGRLGGRSDAQLLAAIDHVTALCGRLFITHSYVTVAGGEYTAQLKALLDRLLPDHPAAWETGLTSALGDVVSAQPVRAIWRLAQTARGLPAVEDDFAQLEMATLKRRLAAPPNADWRGFAQAFNTFAMRYGFRGQREVDPSLADWGEDPTFVLSAVRAHLATPAEHDPAASEREASAARERLEGEIGGLLAPPDRAEFRELLGKVQRFVRAREQTKESWAQASRAFRPPLLELGRRLTERGVLNAADDLFFLRLAELRALVDGDPAPTDLRERIVDRQREYARLQHFDLPATFTLPTELVPLTPPAVAGGTLQGLGVSAGVATGRAHIVLSAEAAAEADIAPGEILVAPFTDAPWTPLFWPAAAVVTETGGLLSHAATVAREYGIPAVVGVAGATRAIPPGALVTVDGGSGTVTIA